MKQILITGAGGFIGSHLVERALDDGWAVWAGVRSTTGREYLHDPRIRFLELPYDDPSALRSVLVEHGRERGPWDVVVHNMGLTKTTDVQLFERINCGHVQRLVEALRLTEMLPRQFILMSSLSAFGPIHEADGLPIALGDGPQPDSAYGWSKLHVARWLMAQPDVPYVIFYPTGVYGPRDRDYLLMFRTLRAGFDFVPGLRPQRLTFVYVRDLVEAVFRAIDLGRTQREYIVAEPRAYAPAEVRRLACRELGRRWAMPLRVPLWMLRAACSAAGWIAARAGRASTLNADKYHLLAQRNWQADVSALQADLGYVPQTPLAEGFRETVGWYKEHRWL